MAARRLARPSRVAPALQAVADGVFYAELNELLMRELGGEGYSGVEVSGHGWSPQPVPPRAPDRLCCCPCQQVRVTPMRTEVIIRATRTQNVLGERRHAHRCLSLCSPAARLPAGIAIRTSTELRRATAATSNASARTLARGRRRQGPPHPRADQRGAEALQVP